MTFVLPPPVFKRMHIATCGINCGTCLAYLREKNRCLGCNSSAGSRANHCEVCSIKHCAELKKSGGRFCFSCEKFPCQRIRLLDKRYRTKYGLSLINNLRSIERNGLREFLRNEHERWKCSGCGKTICVHRPDCLSCEMKRRINFARAL